MRHDPRLHDFARDRSGVPITSLTSVQGAAGTFPPWPAASTLRHNAALVTAIVDTRSAKLTEREVAVKDRWAECRLKQRGAKR